MLACSDAFAQLHGSKRFIVAPPSAATLLRPFPFLHPSHAQCQAQLPSLAAAELAAVGALEVRLSAGDLLYLPPLWFHETAAEGDSISVNGWTDSDEADAAAELFALRRPARPAASAGVLAAAASAARLIDRLSSVVEGAPGALGRLVWRERYASLSRELALDWGRLPAPSCGALAPGSRGVHPAAAADPSDAAPNAAAAAAEPSDAAAEAQAWVSAVAHIALARIPAASRPLWLGNLVELVAAEHVGVARVAPLLSTMEACRRADPR